MPRAADSIADMVGSNVELPVGAVAVLTCKAGVNSAELGHKAVMQG